MNQVATINTGNYAAMAEAMGMSVDNNRSHRQAHLHVCVSITQLSWVRKQ
jgi:hypothetical protein